MGVWPFPVSQRNEAAYLSRTFDTIVEVRVEVVPTYFQLEVNGLKTVDVDNLSLQVF